MASKHTGRKLKNVKSHNDEMEDVSLFILPDSIPLSQIEFPVLIPRKNKASWEAILQESERKAEEIQTYVENKTPKEPKAPFIKFPVLIPRKNKASWEAILQESERKAEEIQTYVENKTPKEPKAPFINTECDYIQKEVFPYLLPALEEALNKAQLWDALKTQKCFFNGIDYIAQELWNRNPRYPIRKDHNLHVFNMPWVREYLKHNPRPHYPKSWLWTENYAATVIQKTVRQYFVQREPEVHELREFWEKLDIELKQPDISANPLFAKKFASGSLSRDKHTND